MLPVPLSSWRVVLPEATLVAASVVLVFSWWTLGLTSFLVAASAVVGQTKLSSSLEVTAAAASGPQGALSREALGLKRGIGSGFRGIGD